MIRVSVLLVIPLVFAAPLETCPDAPTPPEDRRNPGTTVTFATYNMYWLFDGRDDPRAVPWSSYQGAYSHARTMARELDRIQADVFVLVEVEHCSILDKVLEYMSTGEKYRRYLVQGEDGATHQDVALLTKIDPLISLQRSSMRIDYPVSGSQCADDTQGKTGVSKHYYTELKLGDGFRVGLVAVHLLARPTDTTRCPQREAQAHVIKNLISSTFGSRLGTELQGVVVMGDFNEFSAGVEDTENSQPLSGAVEIIMSATQPGMAEASQKVAKSERYTYGTGGKGEMIDHILLTEDLFDRIVDAGIDHRESASRDVGASDHWCFWVTLTVGTSSDADECQSTPCGKNQRCTDVDQSTQGNYVCSCKQYPTVQKSGAPAACIVDECATRVDPCGGRKDQDCFDPNTSPLSLNDYECSCKGGSGIMAVGMPAVCLFDECKNSSVPPCSADQECSDPNPEANSLNDFLCSCTDYPQVQSRGTPVSTCVVNECLSSPCGMVQSCSDPDLSPGSLGDYICACENKEVMAKGRPAVCENGDIGSGMSAVCEKDECEGKPCGTGQLCIDRNLSAGSLGDFQCSCATGEVSTGTPAACVVDECSSNPCGADQQCKDPDLGSFRNFICTCLNGATSVGREANCAGEDECLDAVKTAKCAEGETCVDPDPTVQEDYYCEFDECGEGSACPVGARCVDPDTNASSRGDVRCEVDECTAGVCGEGQVCRDPKPTTGDFVCSIEVVGAAVNLQCDRDGGLPFAAFAGILVGVLILGACIGAVTASLYASRGVEVASFSDVCTDQKLSEYNEMALSPARSDRFRL